MWQKYRKSWKEREITCRNTLCEKEIGAKAMRIDIEQPAVDIV